jgi:hypothetical protein
MASEPPVGLTAPNLAPTPIPYRPNDALTELIDRAIDELRHRPKRNAVIHVRNLEAEKRLERENETTAFAYSYSPRRREIGRIEYSRHRGTVLRVE